MDTTTNPLISQTERAIDAGEIGKAYQLFEQYCVELESAGVDPEQDPETLRLAAGILLLQQCELETAADAIQPAD